jgi:hypothetical protein
LAFLAEEVINESFCIPKIGRPFDDPYTGRDFTGAIYFTFKPSFRFLLEPEIEFIIIKPGDRWFDPL